MPIYTCCHCEPADRQIYTTINDLETHIASDHLSIFPYDCDRCKYAKFATEYALACHYQTDHHLTEFVIKYRYSPELIAKREELQTKLSQSLINSSTPSLVMNTINGVAKGEFSFFGGILEEPSLGNESYDDFLGTDTTFQRQERDRASREVARHKRSQNGSVPRPHKPAVRIQCALCPDIVSKQRSSMVYHANTRHSKYELYECALCHRRWQTIARSDVVKHLKSHHNISPNDATDDMIIDYRKNLGNKLNEITDQCFPERKKRRIGYRDYPLPTVVPQV